MQILFQIDAQNDWEDPDFTKYTKDITFGDQEDYAKKLVTAVCAKHADIDAMLDAQSADVDVVAGATKTSEALIAAVKDALAQVK